MARRARCEDDGRDVPGEGDGWLPRSGDGDRAARGRERPHDYRRGNRPARHGQILPEKKPRAMFRIGQSQFFGKKGNANETRLHIIRAPGCRGPASPVQGGRMTRRSVAVAVLIIGSFLVVPSIALAQSAIAGVVRDTSGAVLPGVTVEASSAALIEKVKSATTNE